jgi:hypothetical protein
MLKIKVLSILTHAAAIFAYFLLPWSLGERVWFSRDQNRLLYKKDPRLRAVCISVKTDVDLREVKIVRFLVDGMCREWLGARQPRLEECHP